MKRQRRRSEGELRRTKDHKEDKKTKKRKILIISKLQNRIITCIIMVDIETIETPEIIHQRLFL